jgi:hypothetical protein
MNGEKKGFALSKSMGRNEKDQMDLISLIFE